MIKNKQSQPHLSKAGEKTAQDLSQNKFELFTIFYLSRQSRHWYWEVNKWNPLDRINWIFTHKYRHLPSCQKVRANKVCLSGISKEDGSISLPQCWSEVKYKPRSPVHMSIDSSINHAPPCTISYTHLTMCPYKPWDHTLTKWCVCLKTDKKNNKNAFYPHVWHK